MANDWGILNQIDGDVMVIYSDRHYETSFSTQCNGFDDFADLGWAWS